MLKKRIHETTLEGGSGVRKIEDENDSKKSWRNGAKRCIGGVAAGTVLFTGAGISAGNASADRIWVGGACDGSGEGIKSTAVAQGRWAPGDEVARYPASMAPVSCPDVHNTSAYDSIRIGGQQVVDFYYRHQNDPWVDAEGFSLGAGAVNWASMELAKRHGGRLPWNFHPVTVGDGWSEAGVLNHPLAAPAAVITRPLGIPTTWELHPVPGTTVRNDANDFFGTTAVGPWDIPAQIGRWIGAATGSHRIPANYEPHSVVERDGIRYEYFGPAQAHRAWEHATGHVGFGDRNMPDGMLTDFLRNGAAMGNVAPGSYDVTSSGTTVNRARHAENDTPYVAPPVTRQERVVVQNNGVRRDGTAKQSVVTPHVNIVATPRVRAPQVTHNTNRNRPNSNFNVPKTNLYHDAVNNTRSTKSRSSNMPKSSYGSHASEPKRAKLNTRKDR